MIFVAKLFFKRSMLDCMIENIKPANFFIHWMPNENIFKPDDINQMITISE